MADGEIARLGVGRLGAFRLGAFAWGTSTGLGGAWVKILINGVDRTGSTRIAGASITDELNHEPNTVTLLCDSFTPVEGHDVKIYLGDTDLEHQLFGGVILSLGATYEGRPINVVWQVKCIDYTWLLNRKKVLKKYSSQSATAIVQDLITNYTGGFTSAHVTSGLASLDEITFTNEEVTDAITRVMERVGGYWYSDYSRDIHAFLTDTDAAGSVTDSVARTMADMLKSVDLSQVATRIVARGGGSTTAADVAVGATTIPLVDAALTWYPITGGTVDCGPQRFTYTGVAAASETGSTTGYIAPPAAPVFLAGTGGALTNGATYLIGVTFVTAEGETTMGALQSVTLTGGGVTGLYGIGVGCLPVPADPKITSKNIYLSTANGDASTLKVFANTPASTVSADILSHAVGAAPPTVNAAGLSSIPSPAGSTTLTVEDLSVFAASGWAEVGGIVFSYTGRSASSGSGTLTGIPASGVGSLTAAVRGGTVRSIPHLTGVSGVLYPINKGEPVNCIAVVNDAAAQAVMAAAVGGDGLHIMFISDGRWSITEATARANAELAMRKDPLVTVTFETRDQTVVAGRDITITLTNPPISGTFKIQRVTFSQIGIGGLHNTVLPLRHVECSSRRFSFEDVLRQIKMRAA